MNPGQPPGRLETTGWNSISRHPLWSALIATVVGGLILAGILGGIHAFGHDGHSSQTLSGTQPSGSPPASNAMPTTGHPSKSAGSNPVPTSAAPTQPPRPQYSSVSFASLCSSQDATQSNFGDCSDEQTATIGQSVYAFSSYAYAYDPASDNDPPLLSLPSTTCRSLSLRFAIQPSYGTPSELRVTVSVKSRGSQSVTIAPNQLGTMKAPLSGGPFEIDASANRPMGGGWLLLMDGHASCSTNSGS